MHQTLSGLELKPRNNAEVKNLVILFHGLGADGRNLIDIAGVLNRFIPNTHFISPNAPYPYDMAPVGYQWFSRQDRSREAAVKGLKNVENTVNDFIDYQLERFTITEKNLAVIGFSQGCMVALHCLLRRRNPAALVVGFSGALIGPELLDKELLSKPPVLLIHGEDDDILPIDLMLDAYEELSKRNIPVEKHAYPHLGHSIGQKGFELATNRIKQAFNF